MERIGISEVLYKNQLCSFCKIWLGRFLFFKSKMSFLWWLDCAVGVRRRTLSHTLINNLSSNSESKAILCNVNIIQTTLYQNQGVLFWILRRHNGLNYLIERGRVTFHVPSGPPDRQVRSQRGHQDGDQPYTRITVFLSKLKPFFYFNIKWVEKNVISSFLLSKTVDFVNFQRAYQ